MRIKGTDDLKGLIRFASDPERQTEDDRLTFTILDLFQIVGEGRIDYHERQNDVARRIKRPSRRSSNDPAGHWDLGQGAYWGTYNETIQIPEGCSLFLQPHDSLLQNGLWHPTLLIKTWADLTGVLLVVTSKGVRMMEGAAISTGYVIESN